MNKVAAVSHHRGHPIVYIDEEWLYADTKEPISIERPCVRCGRMPTKEGYDACLGHIPGAVSVCCGHGVEEPILILKPPAEVENTGTHVCCFCTVDTIGRLVCCHCGALYNAGRAATEFELAGVADDRQEIQY